MADLELNDVELLLAAEDFTDENFEKYHVFSDYENKIIRKLIAHGPVLLRGGRGSGKSAMLKEAYFRVNREDLSKNILGIYMSLRQLPLLRFRDKDYESFLCNFIRNSTNDILRKLAYDIEIDSENEASSLQESLSKLGSDLGKRIILFFDDAAHIGREASLSEFFDVFRMLSSSLISCKAAIYPGVTEFGTRFDVLNDATVVDITRKEDSQSFEVFFADIIKRRYADTLSQSSFSQSLSIEKVALFLGRAVVGNVRAFIYACNHLSGVDRDGTIGLIEIEKTLKFLAADYYWPLLDEVEPKLGTYEVLIEPARDVAEQIFELVSKDLRLAAYMPACIIHREHVNRLKKILEILEYVGFLSKRDASRAMKSGGRGTKYALNLCNLIEKLSPSRLTLEHFTNWIQNEKEATQIHKGGVLEKIPIPERELNKELGIFQYSIEQLEKSNVYPYGLTPRRIQNLKEAGYDTIGKLAEASDDALLGVSNIGPEWLRRTRNVVGQAIWM